jgi:hypothetical protein
MLCDDVTYLWVDAPFSPSWSYRVFLQFLSVNALAER